MPMTPEPFYARPESSPAGPRRRVGRLARSTKQKPFSEHFQDLTAELCLG